LNFYFFHRARAVCYTIFMTMTTFAATSFLPNTIESMILRATIQDMNREITNIQGVVKIDSTRTASIQKIVRLIEQYNPMLDLDTKIAIADEVYIMSIRYDNLDVDLICATISHESAFTWQNDIVSPAGAMGLMQIMPDTGYFLSRHEGIAWTNARDVLFNPIYNIRLGCRYLSSLIDVYQIDGGLAAYNGGERQAARWLQSGRNNAVLVAETRNYIPAILKLYETYRN